MIPDEAVGITTETLAGRLVWCLYKVDEIGKRRAGTMADCASLEWARLAEKLARIIAHRERG